VDAPPSAQQSGYDALGLLPLKAGRSVLAYVEPIDPARWTQPVMDSAQLRQILHLFDHTYFRGDAATQQALLPLLRASAAQATAAAWEGIPLSVRTAMLMPRDRELQATIRQHLPVQTVLSNADGQARLRYLGSDVRQTPMDKPDGLQSDLFFEVIAPLDESYSLWFHIVDNATDDQWMIYDYFPATPTQHWQEATVYKFPVEIELEPASYDISFGLWTPNVRERLYVDQAKDIYWLNMGTHTVEPDP
jgi:hypothetical protein